jgi:MFS family permease
LQVISSGDGPHDNEIRERLPYLGRCFSNYLVGLRGLGATEWRWQLGVTAIPAAAFLLALIAIPESPRWLVKRNRRDEALVILERIGEADPAAQIARMVRSRWKRLVGVVVLAYSCVLMREPFSLP